MLLTKGERIAKRIARVGLCSRRVAERWINEGRVSLDGKVLRSPAINVKTEAVISVDGKIIPEIVKTRLWCFHKPPRVMTTNQDSKRRRTVFEILPKHLPRVVTVGRLDFNSEGLLLLTNDGNLSHNLEHPKWGWRRCYRVRVHGKVDEKSLAGLSEGIEVDGSCFASIDARLERKQRSNSWIYMAISEGKNREVKRICSHLGLQVTRLIRTSYGPFRLGKLLRGQTIEIPEKIILKKLAPSNKSIT